MKIFTVSELTHEIKKQLEQGIGTRLVQGEVSNLKQQSSGHVYFTLKDAASQISAVLFKGAIKNLSRIPKEGDQIVACGEITVYPPRGNYQFLIREIQYKGIGELLAKLHALKTELEAKGYFDSKRKKPLPKTPKTIGVVTSPTGAVIQDILNVLQRRHAGFHLILNPVKVQGEGSAEEVAKAIDQMNAYSLADVLIVARGGGSLEDLFAFNEKIVVEAIVRSKIPVISAIGHETDVTLADFAADLRAPTPSAAAELVLAEKKQLQDFLIQATKRIQTHCRLLKNRYQAQLQSIRKHPYLASPYLLLSQRIEQLDDLQSQILLSCQTHLKQKKMQLAFYSKQNAALQPSQQILSWRRKFSLMQTMIHAGQMRYILRKKESVDLSLWQKKVDQLLIQKIQRLKDKLIQIVRHLQSIDPKNLLTKGYCILFSEISHSVILSTKDLVQEDRLRILMQDGQIYAKIEEIQHDASQSLKL